MRLLYDAIAATRIATHVFLEQGNISQAYKVAKDTMRVVQPVSGNKFAAAAMADLWQCAQCND